jgi:hypothetical protein
MEGLPSLVQEFNALPRTHTTLFPLLNRWIFSLRHIPLPTPGYIVYIINPEMSYMFMSKQLVQIPSDATAADKAQAMLPQLLGAFLHMGEGYVPRTERLSPTAPWTWCCDDPDLAVALGVELESKGVREELCSVAVASAQEAGQSNDNWGKVFEDLVKKFGGDTKAVEAKTLDDVGVGAGSGSIVSRAVGFYDCVWSAKRQSSIPDTDIVTATGRDQHQQRLPQRNRLLLNSGSHR